MEIAKQQINRLIRGVGLASIQTMPTLLVVLWLSSETVGWGLFELLGYLAEAQPICPLLELIKGA